MMLTVKNSMNNEEVTYKLNKPEDFQAIFDEYPMAERIAIHSDSTEDAAKNIAAYISRSSYYDAWIHSGVHKTEVEPEKEEPKDVRLDLQNNDSFSLSVKLWAEKMAEKRRGIHRDNTFTPDPGRLRDKKLDEQDPVTGMDRIKAKIEEFK